MRITKKHITEAIIGTKPTTDKTDEKVTDNDVKQAEELKKDLEDIKKLEKEIFGLEEAENKRNTKEIIKVSELKKQESEFAESRLNGAKNISSNAKDKGGFSLLTYYHFKVKLPYYKKAAAGRFDLEKAKKEFEETYKKISTSMTQIEFQREVGRLEVLGELIIREERGR